MIRSQWDKFKQGLNIGFIRADSRLVVDLEECKIAEPALNDQIKHVRAHPPPKGGMKVVLRIPPEGWEVPPDSFFQNNFFLLPGLVRVVRERLREAGTRYLLDVYCGVGFFSIELGDLVESFVGVELDRLAIQAARRNAAARSRSQRRVRSRGRGGGAPGACCRVSPRGQPPCCSTRRARVALQRRCTCCAEARPAQIIYVSCHPATMARDLNVLCAEGVFEVAQVVPLDMFPHTQHVECVADLRCKLAAPDQN